MILFVRKCATKDEALSIYDAIQLGYKNLNFTLLVVDETEEIKADWKTPNIINRYLPLTQQETWATRNAWEGDNEAWEKALSEVVIIPNA